MSSRTGYVVAFLMAVEKALAADPRANANPGPQGKICDRADTA